MKSATATGVLVLLAVLFAATNQPWSALIAGISSGYFAHVSWNAFEQLADAAEKRAPQRRSPR